ncbi:MAG TPA: DUF4919 domain-containing protein [Pyrinomonadaceae bacterium]|nr:DUF4919 domain-containing protein [Pyrinomonadaceae bacterium]
MKNLKTLTALLMLALTLTFTVAAQKTDDKFNKIPLVKTDSSEYKTLVEKAKQGDSSVDYVKMRAAFLDWVNDECNQTDAPDRDKMVKAFESKDWAKSVELGEKVLDYEFVNRGLHLAVANSYKELKNAEKEKYHNDIADKLLKALLASGDGKTPKTAYKVHSIREEYIIMKELGYKVNSQSLIFDKEYGSFDVLAGKDANEKSGEFYFDINSFFGGGQSKPCKVN